MNRVVLVVTWDGAGNIPPEVAACRALVEAGHSVHVLTHDVLRARFENVGAEFRPILRAGQLDSTNPDETVVEIAGRALFSEALLQESKDAMEALAPDLAIADSMLLPVLALFAQSKVPSVTFHHSLGRFLFGGFFDQLSFSMKPQFDELLTSNGLHPYERPVDAAAASDLILSATFDAFRPPGRRPAVAPCARGTAPYRNPGRRAVLRSAVVARAAVGRGQPLHELHGSAGATSEDR